MNPFTDFLEAQATAYSHGVISEQNFLSTCLLELKNKKQDKACRMAISTLKTKPRWAAPYLVLGRFSEMCFEDDEAIDYYKKALVACPDCITTYDLLADLLRRNTDYKGCLEIVTKGLLKLGKQNSGSFKVARVALLSRRTEALRATKHYVQAIEARKQSINLYPESGELLMDLAEMYNEVGYYQKTIDIVDGYLKKHPNDTTGSYYRGFAFAQLGQSQRAIADLSRFIERNRSTIAFKSEDRKARLLRAQLYEKIGKTALAKADLAFLEKEQKDAYDDTVFRSTK